MPDKTSYRDAGVNIDAQDEALREVRHIARGTFTPDVVSDIGLFGGLFRANFGGMQSPIYLDADFLVGPEAAHLNISGVSGLATKTSAIEWLLSSIFTHFPAHRGSVATADE